MAERIRTFLLTGLLLMVSLCTMGQLRAPSTIDVRIGSGQHLSTLQVFPAMGRYLLTDSTGKVLLQVAPYQPMVFSATPGGLELTAGGSTRMLPRAVRLQGLAFDNQTRLRIPGHTGPARPYDDDLLISLRHDSLRVINRVAFEKYIAGVVQAESGLLQHPEFYKVQATIARTYALRNIGRHTHEEYHLCDQVHCQAYHGASHYPTIVRGVLLTRGQVVADAQGRLIDAVYHANCGGQTAASEQVWSQALPYLRPVADPWCTAQRGALWHDTIPLADMVHFLEATLGHEAAEPPQAFHQPHRRPTLDDQQQIPLRLVRSHFNLRSTFFSFQQQHGQLIVTGRGYGHGVGLCQEGAMEMARQGFTPDHIIRFYYQGVQILLLDEEGTGR